MWQGSMLGWLKVRGILFQEGRNPSFCKGSHLAIFLLQILPPSLPPYKLGEKTEMLTNNKWDTLTPHLLVCWRASLYLMYSGGTKTLIRGRALDRKIKSNRYWGFLNQSLRSHKIFPLGHSFLYVKKIKEFCRPKGPQWSLPLSTDKEVVAHRI